MNVIQGPIEGHGHSDVTDIASYEALHSSVMKKAEKEVFEIEEPVEAYINHGRWVVDCECNGAGFTSPAFKFSCCFDCGRRYMNIVFPKNPQKIEKELLKRREARNRNWTGESLQTLAAEG